MNRKVAIISEHASPLTHLGGVDSGGQNVYVGQTARSLAALGWEVDVFTRRDNPSVPEIVDWVDGVRIVHVRAGPAEFVPKEKLLPYMKDFADHVLRYCRRESYQLMHANFWMSGLVAADVKKAAGIPFVITFHALGKVRRLHQGKSDGFPDDRFAIEERIVDEADAIVAECPQEKADLVEHYNADPARISLVPAGFDPGELEPVNKMIARIAMGLPLDERLILQLGRMVPRKGVDNVIQALARLQERHEISARLVVVGGEADEPDPLSTPEIGRLQEIAEAEGVADQVSFVGRKGREMLRLYYSAADVFVTTPWYEPFGITPLESMACATPVIGARVGGIKTTVKDGETGYLVPPRDPDALAERLAHLFRNPELIELLGARGKQHVRENYTWKQVTRALADLYEDVLEKDRPCRAPAREGVSADDGGASPHKPRLSLADLVRQAADRIADCFAGGGKVLVCGSHDGAEAFKQRFSRALRGRFRERDRIGLPIISLSADDTIVSACGSREGFRSSFARQVESLGQPGDLLIGLGTGGAAPQLAEAFQAARRFSLNRLALLDRNGGRLYTLSDLAIVIPSSDPRRIEELQGLVLQMLAKLVQERLGLEEAQEQSGIPAKPDVNKHSNIKGV